MRRGRGRRRRNDVQSTEYTGTGETQHARRLALAPPDRAFCFSSGLERALRMFVEGSAVISERECSRRALKHQAAEMIFQGGDLSRNGRLRHVQIARNSSERSGFYRPHKAAEEGEGV